MTNPISVIWSDKNNRLIFVASLLVLWLVFGFLFGLFELPWHDPLRLLSIIEWSLFWPNFIFLILAGFLNAALITITYARFRELVTHRHGKPMTLAAGSVLLSAVFAACPFCVISLTAVLGVSLVAQFIAPFYGWFQIASLLVTTGAIVYTNRQIGTACTVCAPN